MKNWHWWDKYMGDYLAYMRDYSTPREYKYYCDQHDLDVEKAITKDLMDLWLNHSTDPLTQDEIDVIAVELAYFIENSHAIYKVVFRIICSGHEGGVVLRSIFATQSASVRYFVDKWAEAPGWLAEKGYHLLVFTNLKDAKTFMYLLPEGLECNLEIWECEVMGQVRPPPICFSHKLGCYDLDVCKTIGMDWPSGTAMYEQVKLTKKVK